MAPKRPATASPQGKGRSPKAAKVAEPEQEESGLKFVSELLSEFIDVPPSCAAMLRSALPHAVGTPPGARHAFQKTVVDSVTGLCAEAVKAAEAEVQAAEAKVTSLESDKTSCGEALAAAEKTAGEKAAEKVAAENAEKDAEASLAAAQAAAQAEKDKASKCKEDAEAKASAKADFEKTFAENFEALKVGRYQGKEWGIRNKAIKQIVHLLGQSEAPDSLVAAAQLALKEKPEVRSPFGLKVVDAVEAAIKSHIEIMERGIEQQQAVVATQCAAVGFAEEAVKVAQQKLEASQSTMIDAENLWLECDAAATKAKKALQDVEKLDPKEDLDSATASLERLRVLVRQFEQAQEGAMAS